MNFSSKWVKRGSRESLALLLLATLGLAGTLVAQGSPERPPHPSRLELPTQEFELPDAEALRFVLANGIPVYFAPDASVPLVEIAVVVAVGGASDPDGQEGLAALTGSMLRRAGAGGLSADDYDERVDYLGAQIDTFGGVRRSGLSLSTSPPLLEPAWKLAFSALTEPHFAPARLETARANLQKGLHQRNDDPAVVAGREWRFLMRGENHADSRQLTGSSLKSLDREALLEFHRRYYQPSRMVVAVSGAVSEKTLRPLLEETLGSLAGSDSERLPETAVSKMALSTKPRHPPGSKARVYHYESDAPQAMVWLGHLLPEGSGLDGSEWTDRRRFVAILLSEILGGSGPVSRLRSALRAERSLVYRVGAGLAIGSEDRGQVEISLATEPELVAVAVAEARAQIERLRRERVSEVELSLAKRSLLSSFPLLFESAESVAGRYAEDELLDRPHSYWQAYLDVLPQVTAAELQGLARQLLEPGRLALLVVGPAEKLPMRELESFGSLTTLPARDPVELKPLVKARASENEDD